MSARTETRLPIRFFNSVYSLFGDNFSTKFRAEQLLETAVRKNGLSDFGEDFFLEGLEVLCDSLNKDAGLHSLGKFFAKGMISTSLRNRLELRACYKQNPEVLNNRIVKPVFIVGLPRTGTTLLFNLLALDDQFQYLRAWEAVRPGMTNHNKNAVSKAIAKKNYEIKFINYLKPDIKKIHFVAPHMPEECIPLLNNSFESDFFSFHFKTDSYYDWFYQHDHEQCYREYHDQLKWLQSRKNGSRWLLKSPIHLLAFKTLFETFPDALVIQTHRDPVEVIPSVGSLMYNFQSMTTYDVARKDIGEPLIEELSQILQNTLALRDRNGYNVCDIQYEDLILHPIKSLEKIYQHMGKTMSAAMKAYAETYLKENPKDKHGRHEYSLDQYGITSERIHTAFDFYYHRFDLGRR